MAAQIIGEAFVEIKPDAKNFAQKAESDVKTQSTSLAKTAATAFAVTFAAAKLFSFGKDALREAEEARKVAAQTAAVIKSTGGAAKVSTKDVDALATAISNKTGIDDEQIASAENLLLTFTKVRNEVGATNDIFDQATQIAVDMGAAFGKDATSSIVQLGKALNDPTKGITALTRVGVTFTAQQKQQIKTLQASGDILGAQKIILAELATEFGGSAAAQATASDKLGVVIGNLKEDIGTKLLPIVDEVAQGLSVVLPKALDIATDVFAGAADIFQPLIDAGENVFDFFFDPAKGALGKSNWERGLEVVSNAIDDFLEGKDTNNQATAAQVAKDFGIPELPIAGPAAPAQGGLLGVTLQDVQHDKTILAIADDNASNASKLVAKTGQIISDAFGLKLDLHASQIGRDFDAGFAIIKNDFLVGAVETREFLRTHGGEALGNFVLDVGNATADALSVVGPILGGALKGLGDLVSDPAKIPAAFGNLALNVADFVVSSLQDAFGGVVTTGVNIILGTVNAIGAGVDAALAAPGQLLGLGARVVSNFVSALAAGAFNAGKDLVNVGVTIVDHIVDGIVSAGGAIAKAILSFIPKPQDLPGLIVSGAKSAFNFVTGREMGGVASGLTVVGERGPEIVRLPVGSQVIPNEQIRSSTQQTFRTGSTFHVEQLVLPVAADASPLEMVSTLSEHLAWRFGMEAA
jgi:hypothetical protein